MATTPVLGDTVSPAWASMPDVAHLASTLTHTYTHTVHLQSFQTDGFVTTVHKGHKPRASSVEIREAVLSKFASFAHSQVIQH